ncbi:c-type cytochrome [Sulfobacillus harzensis]|uniref:Cytochrome c n=1 Tax=Sulfobacillus harzensis TaxID=2729629 RepID=A0A7Y0L228_9FIRM|nr:cytochrome c [Sulfobacillus harzensis]NMP21790.1 cytochrome c [Sulfobacillus harzensis]
MSRGRGFIVLAGLIVPLSLMASGCGNKPAPSAKNASHKAAKTVNNAAHKAKPTRVSKIETSGPVRPLVGNARKGASLFARDCQSCHGRGGGGTSRAPRLAKPSSVVATFGTESALASFIAHNMPANNPGSLSPQQAANAASYVWHLAGK